MSFRGQTCQTALLLNSRFRKHTNTVRVNIYPIPSQNLYSTVQASSRLSKEQTLLSIVFFSLGALAIHLPLYPSILPSIHRFSPHFLRWSKERGLGVTKIAGWAAASVDGFTSPTGWLASQKYFRCEGCNQVLFGCLKKVSAFWYFRTQQKLYNHIMWL